MYYLHNLIFKFLYFCYIFTNFASRSIDFYDNSQDIYTIFYDSYGEIYTIFYNFLLDLRKINISQQIFLILTMKNK